MNRIQMSNKRYGSLVVLEFSGNGRNGAKWECQCDCGNTKIVDGYLLRRGAVKTCGCGIGFKNDFVGKQFGKLKILKKVGTTKDRSLLWKAICSCGNTINIPSKYLLSGKTKSCGCLRKIKAGEFNFNKLIANYQNSAKRKKIPFSLTTDQFRELTKRNCYYCGSEPKQEKHRKFSNGLYVFNGIDRIDNSRGYTLDNAATCCFVCNRAKGNMKYDDFINWIKKVSNKWQK